MMESAMASKSMVMSILYCQARNLILNSSFSRKSLLTGFLSTIPKDERSLLKKLEPFSHSQNAQDLFVTHMFNKHNIPPFFVEAGAGDGVHISNTYLLEKHLGWSGLLVEPCPSVSSALRINRSCMISTVALSRQSGQQVKLKEVLAPRVLGLQLLPNAGWSELSTTLQPQQESLNSSDQWSFLRNSTKEHLVDTATLDDLLTANNAPRHIGYLSLDLEGSELDILSTIDFNRWRIECITVEHNYDAIRRQAIASLLKSSGYRRVHETISRFDDWYILGQE